MFKLFKTLRVHANRPTSGQRGRQGGAGAEPTQTRGRTGTRRS